MTACKYCSKDVPSDKKIGLYDMDIDGTVLFFCPHCKKMIQEGPYWHWLPIAVKQYWANGGTATQ